MHCPICGTTDRFDFKSVMAFLLLGLFLGFVGGQIFYGWQIKPIFKDRLEYLEKSNKELKKGYVPPKGSILEY